MVVFGSPVTNVQYVGYFIALLGMYMHKEYKKNPAIFGSSNATAVEAEKVKE